MANAADEIAYLNHDLDDALRFGVMRIESLSSVPLVGDAIRDTAESVEGAPDEIRRARVIVALIERIVSDLVGSTVERVEASGAADVQAVRSYAEPLVGFSPGVGQAKGAAQEVPLRKLLSSSARVGEHPRGGADAGAALEALRADPRLLPESVRNRFSLEGEARAIADYVAGMTDRFALAEHERLLGPRERRVADPQYLILPGASEGALQYARRSPLRRASSCGSSRDGDRESGPKYSPEITEFQE